MDRGSSFSFNCHSVYGRKAKGSQHAKPIFLKTTIRISNAANDAILNVLSSAYEVNNTLLWTVSQSVHGKVSSLQILFQATGKMDGIGMAMI